MKIGLNLLVHEHRTPVQSGGIRTDHSRDLPNAMRHTSAAAETQRLPEDGSNDLDSVSKRHHSFLSVKPEEVTHTCTH